MSSSNDLKQKLDELSSQTTFVEKLATEVKENQKKLRLFSTSISNTGKIEKHNSKNIKVGLAEPLKEQAKYFLKSMESRKIQVNNSKHALDVVSVLENSTKLINKV